MSTLRHLSPEDVWCRDCDGDGHIVTCDDQAVTCPFCHGKGLPETYRTEDWDDRPGLPAYPSLQER